MKGKIRPLETTKNPIPLDKLQCFSDLGSEISTLTGTYPVEYHPGRDHQLSSNNSKVDLTKCFSPLERRHAGKAPLIYFKNEQRGEQYEQKANSSET
ncbi:hypothetical protein HQN90_19465 [Paenibacillus alba]|nr:hypothetical protein [Paenibacillus alba]